MVVVDLSLAVICFAGQCYNALVGENTVPGTYELQRRIVIEEIYKGDVLQFDENETTWFAIHRIIPGRSTEQENRRRVTAGCINVDDAVYEKLIDCCRNSTLLIR